MTWVSMIAYRSRRAWTFLFMCFWPLFLLNTHQNCTTFLLILSFFTFSFVFSRTIYLYKAALLIFYGHSQRGSHKGIPMKHGIYHIWILWVGEGKLCHSTPCAAAIQYNKKRKSTINVKKCLSIWVGQLVYSRKPCSGGY